MVAAISSVLSLQGRVLYMGLNLVPAILLKVFSLFFLLMNFIWQNLPYWPNEHIGKAFISQLLLSQ